MALLKPDKVRGLDPHTGEAFYWRGWYDGIRCNGDNGTHVTLRNSMGPQYDFEGRIVSQVVGRKSPPFKTVPRYVDLYLFEQEVKEKGQAKYVAQRRWISEAHGEEPCVYTIIHANDLEEMFDNLMNYDPVAEATGLYPEDQPGGKRRNERMKDWLRRTYAERVRALVKAAQPDD